MIRAPWGLIPLPWDSDFFGFRIGRLSGPDGRFDPVSLNDAMGRARGEGYDCLYFEPSFADPDLLSACSRRGFFLVDVKTTLSKSPLAPTEGLEETDDGIIENPDRSLWREIERIAETVSMKSRFRFDPRFGPNGALRLYREWARKTLDGSLAARTLTFLEDGRVKGFLSLRTKDGLPHIDLLGLDESARGRGLAARLLRSAERATRSTGSDRVDVVTQGHNIEALRAYEKGGFRTIRANPFFHVWLEDLE